MQSNTDTIPAERRLWGNRAGVRWLQRLNAANLHALAADAAEVTPQVRDLDPDQLLAQLGHTTLPISGGRIAGLGRVAYLPVGRGLVVAIHLAFDDTYTVRRLVLRGGNVTTQAELTGIYCDQIQAVALQASA